MVLSCARSLFSDKGQSSPQCVLSGSRSGVSAPSAPGSFVKVAESVLSGEALATKHKEQNVLFQSCLADDPHFAKQVRSIDDKVGSAPPSERFTSGAEGNLAMACGPRGGRSAGCFESFSEDTECASGPIAGVRSALGVRGGIEGTRTVLDSAGETKGIIGMPEGIESDFSKNRAVDPGAAEKHAKKSLDCMCLLRHFIIHRIHVGVLLLLHVHVCLLLPGVSARVCPVFSSSAVSAAVAHARFTPMHDAHNSWSDTGRLQVPRGGGAPKVGFPVQPKICVLSQRWRQE